MHILRALLVVSFAACAQETSERSTPEQLPFDPHAAAMAVRRVDLRDCGIAEAGHVTITFDVAGTVTRAEVDGGPYAGTAAGACIEAKFRAIRVPAFVGTPVRVGKSFPAS